MNILQLKEETKRRGLCEEYSRIWDAASTEDDIFSLACSVKGADYICSAIHNGYFLAKDEDSNITANTTVIIAIYGKYNITIPEGHICQIFTAGNTELNINSQGKAVLINYDSITPIINGNVRTIDPQKNNTSFLHRK